VETAGRCGIALDRAADFLADSRGLKISCSAISDAAAMVRNYGTIGKASFEEIRQDVQRRGRKEPGSQKGESWKERTGKIFPKL